MAFCGNCGKPVNSPGQYCDNCGTPSSNISTIKPELGPPAPTDSAPIHVPGSSTPTDRMMAQLASRSPLHNPQQVKGNPPLGVSGGSVDRSLETQTSTRFAAPPPEQSASQSDRSDSTTPPDRPTCPTCGQNIPQTSA